MLLLGFASTNASAVAYDARIDGCSNVKQVVSFRVDTSGWYYVSVAFGVSNLSGWYLLTTLQPFSGIVSGGNKNSFFVVTDMKTQTAVVGRCKTWFVSLFRSTCKQKTIATLI